ncbi:MAG: rhomboid family intramembrane serine protease [Desulfobacter postgatei]|uniref:Rhomboid family intramembrane serine protease n=1 Tax=Desulfobacter postgatei TaxID=2293 RepID=A0A2G6MU06_9BACT|nr:MAG: rhomboid family intramembrane serine protease [Desulfobacter postgatei]
MIPLRDEQGSTAFPVATYTIIVITSLVFVWQLIAGIDNPAIIYTFGFVPAKYMVTPMAAYFSWLNKLSSPFTYMFLHGGFWHFMGNMWFLYIFGDNIEQQLGPLRFILFYLVCGLLAAFFHFLLNHSSAVPTIGASGAIAGVMGAYFLLHPGNKILTLIPVFIFPLFVRIPAFVFLGIWFFIQFINATGQGAGASVAWWAHIGGFLSGMAFIGVNNKLPRAGFTEKIDKYTVKKRSPRLHVVTPGEAPAGGSNLYGTIELTSLEALTGTKKLITIPWGFKKSVYRVVVPAGIRRGAMLRLKGKGKSIPGMPPGDLLLRVDIKNVI